MLYCEANNFLALSPNILISELKGHGWKGTCGFNVRIWCKCSHQSWPKFLFTFLGLFLQNVSYKRRNAWSQFWNAWCPTFELPDKILAFKYLNKLKLTIFWVSLSLKLMVMKTSEIKRAQIVAFIERWRKLRHTAANVSVTLYLVSLEEMSMKRRKLSLSSKRYTDHQEKDDKMIKRAIVCNPNAKSLFAHH